MDAVDTHHNSYADEQAMNHVQFPTICNPTRNV